MKAQKSKTFGTDTFLSMDTTFSRIFLLITAISALTVEGVILAAMISGCDAKPKTMEYYKEHAEEARSVVAECKVNQSNDENCANASAALFRIGGKKPIRGDEPHIKTW